MAFHIQETIWATFILQSLQFPFQAVDCQVQLFTLPAFQELLSVVTLSEA